MKALVIDINKCNGCYNCQVACKDEHVGNDWTPIAKPQPDIGQFWMKVTDVVQGSVPKVRVRYMHDICQHCDEAPCIAACRQKAIVKRNDGIVLIDPDKCRGDKSCIDACPYDVIYFNEDLNIAQKCTLCAHLLDKGWKTPRCVDVCPTGALIFGEEDELRDLIEKSEILGPEWGTRPRVHYIGMPRRFIAGAVYDPGRDECIEGASVSLTDLQSGEQRTTATDEFGDFWFNGLNVGSYALSIEKEGYKPHRIKSITTDKDMNLGDVPLLS